MSRNNANNWIQVGGSTRDFERDWSPRQSLRARLHRSNPFPCTIDKAADIYTFTTSTPAKPLHCMLNFGGFFFSGGREK